MSTLIDTLKETTDTLTRGNVEQYPFIPRPTRSLPNMNTTREMMHLVKALLFPGFFDDAGFNGHVTELHVDVHVSRLYSLLDEQIYRSFYFFGDGPGISEQQSSALTLDFIKQLPEIKRLLATDIKAVHDGDPAATSYGEVICCYPAIQAMIYYRVAHELLRMNVPLLPRIITELAHSTTGIDIHPGARIGEYFSIDHGTGVVIGETCIIGNHVRLYQGVTLGAKSFTLNNEGLPVNLPRHPIIEDNVIIYSNSTILGRITIGHDSIIGGNIWQVYDVPPHSRVVQKRATSAFTDGLGI
ncbi:MAG: serine acetyltransferase [Odoribacteraceae bacterium]|jgi:serine O-acetyltransferase|nr:serine acetyltransferase [Odoribacteraceae bacterium]